MITSNNNLRKGIEKELEQMRRAKMQMENKLRDVESIKIPEPVDLMVFEDEIRGIESEIAEARTRIEAINANTSELKESFDRAKRELVEFEEENKRNSEKIDQVRSMYNNLETERDRHKEAIAHYKKFLEQEVPKEREIEKNLATEQAKLDTLMQCTKAESFGERIETKNQSKKIDLEVKEVQKQIQASKELHGDEEEITKKYLEMSTKYKRITEDIKRQKKFLHKLKDALAWRQDSSALFTQSKALRCSMDFSKYLHSRNFTGQLKFDHKEEQLEIIVNPLKTKNNSSEPKDLKSLSGGERSFSTVAFLLSLWSIVECPILFLDEFDVFMDQINRNFAMELILNAAKDKLNGQYVFLTPQEMGSITPDEYVKMFKMPDPKRNIDMMPSHSNDENQEN